MMKAGKGYRSIALLIVAFSIAPSLVLAQGFNGQGNIYARGWSDSVEAAGILRTGTLLPVDTRVSTAPDVDPSLAGSYTSSAQHPRVFITPTDMSGLVTRINSSGSFSAQSFARLSTKVKADLAAKVDWDAVYSGCDLDIYLHAFSYEPTTGYTDEIRTSSQLGSAMHVKEGMSPPTGAAVVASRLALRHIGKIGSKGHLPTGKRQLSQNASSSPGPIEAFAIRKEIF